MSINIEPAKVVLNLGTRRVNLRAITNYDRSPHNLRYEWFKLNPKTNEDESIENNQSALTNELILEGITILDVGKYRCQVTRLNANQKVISNYSEVEVLDEPECMLYYLKNALKT